MKDKTFLMIPGPTPVPESVMLEIAKHPIGHRSSEFSSILKEVYEAFETAKKSDKPFAIIANTTKGKGVSFMENNAGWHGKAPNKEQFEAAIAELS